MEREKVDRGRGARPRLARLSVVVVVSRSGLNGGEIKGSDISVHTWRSYMFPPCSSVRCSWTVSPLSNFTRVRARGGGHLGWEQAARIWVGSAGLRVCE